MLQNVLSSSWTLLRKSIKFSHEMLGRGACYYSSKFGIHIIHIEKCRNNKLASADLKDLEKLFFYEANMMERSVYGFTLHLFKWKWSNLCFPLAKYASGLYAVWLWDLSSIFGHSGFDRRTQVICTYIQYSFTIMCISTLTTVNN